MHIFLGNIEKDCLTRLSNSFSHENLPLFRRFTPLNIFAHSCEFAEIIALQIADNISESWLFGITDITESSLSGVVEPLSNIQFCAWIGGVVSTA
jgi:hypothetical protein